MDFSRLRQGEIVAGIGGIALIVFLFFDWFESTSGWSAYGADLTGFLIALAGIVAVKFAGLAALGKRLNLPAPRGVITLTLGALASLIIVWSLFAADFDGIEFGLFLGLAAAVAITAGAYLALREGGWDPLVSDGSARASSGSTATTRSVASTPARSTSSSTRKKPAAKKKAAAKKRAASSRRS